MASHGCASSLSFPHPLLQSSLMCPPSVMVLSSLACMCCVSHGLEKIPALSLCWHVSLVVGCVQRVGWVNGMGLLSGHRLGWDIWWLWACLVIVLRCCECPQVHVGLCTVYCKVQPCAVHTFLADCCEWVPPACSFTVWSLVFHVLHLV